MFQSLPPILDMLFLLLFFMLLFAIFGKFDWKNSTEQMLYITIHLQKCNITVQFIR